MFRYMEIDRMVNGIVLWSGTDHTGMYTIAVPGNEIADDVP